MWFGLGAAVVEEGLAVDWRWVAAGGWMVARVVVKAVGCKGHAAGLGWVTESGSHDDVPKPMRSFPMPGFDRSHDVVYIAFGSTRCPA